VLATAGRCLSRDEERSRFVPRKEIHPATDGELEGASSIPKSRSSTSSSSQTGRISRNSDYRLCFSYIYTSRIFASINQLCLFDDIFFTIIKRIKALEIFWKNTARFIFILRPCPEVAHPRIVPVAIKFRISRAFSLGLFSRLRAHASPWNLPISPSSPSPSLHPPLSSIACRRGGTITVMGVACVIIVILKLKAQLSQFMSREFQGWKLAAAFNASELPR